MQDYEKLSIALKAIADPNRMKIIDILSCGEQCACDILPSLEMTQPSLSHHMKVLEEAGVISVTKRGQWRHYRLKTDFLSNLTEQVDQLFSDKESCICKEGAQNDCCN
jgi:ArsR family transcriptional regulator